MNVNIIIYTSDLEQATKFYRCVLGKNPTLEVPGMSEFELNCNTVLGIMPAEGIRRILKERINEPNCSKDNVKCEIYIRSDNANQIYNNALSAGGELISGFELRNWGEEVAYCLDLDGNLLAFAKK